VRSSLTLLAALGAALALAGQGGGVSDPIKPELDPNVALKIRAARPARTLPDALRTLAAETGSPAVAQAIRAGLRAPAHAGLQLQRLLAPFSAVVLSVERSCPPPALLACRPAVRFMGRLKFRASRPTRGEVKDVLLAELDAAGFESLHAQTGRRGTTSRITSRGETLARGRLANGRLQVVTGGLGLEPSAPEPPSAALNSSAVVRIDVDADLLASLVGG
jgi:hypothetical protein